MDVRKLIKGSLDEGRKRQSPCTGFVHYCHEDHTSRDTIPIFENFLFCLALFRSNQADFVLEGKDLLLRLLALRSKEGAFAIYMHEMGAIRKPLANVKILFPLIHIWLEYRHVIGASARLVLKEALDKLSVYIDTLDMPNLLKFQKGVFDAVYFGRKMPGFSEDLCVMSKDWSEILMVLPFLGTPLELPWHEGLNVFAGPLLHELKRTTLIDIFKGKTPREDEISPLYGSLIYPFDWIGNVKEKTGDYHHKEVSDVLMSYIDKWKVKEGMVSHGFHLCRMVFGKHELVCQDHLVNMESSFHEGVLDLVFDLQGQDELNFFLGPIADCDILVNGKKATIFYLGDTITIQNDRGGVELCFRQISEEGRFCGHLLRGNRRAQTCPKVDKEWAAYDWQFSLINLQDSSCCKVGLSIATPIACNPLSTYKSDPVIAEASLDSRKAAALATS